MAGGTLYELSGKDAGHFLQNLVTNSLDGLSQGLVYAALLSPQGKYLADFFLKQHGDTILLDIDPALAPATLRRLAMYKLRADVTIRESELSVQQTMEPEGALPDPRHPALGYRRYGPGPSETLPGFDALRVAHVIPQSGVELIPDDSYILECGFERLNGVDFRKGCYVGQEVTARMKHKTELRKGLVKVSISGPAPQGAEIFAGDKPAGQLFTRSGDEALAYLRFDRAEGVALTAGEAVLHWDGSLPA